MYYSIYKSIKQQIIEGLGLVSDPQTGRITNNDPAGLQDIQWFNNQYEGVVHTSPIVFVEFLPLSMIRTTKISNQTDIAIRLHVVSSVSSSSDGHLPDRDIAQNEKLAHDIRCCVEEKTQPFDAGETRPLQLSGWTHQYKYNGWLITLMDLKTKG